MSEEIAYSILQHYVNLVAADLGSLADGVFLVGSLATNSYVEGPGDIDQITILKDHASDEDISKARRHVDSAMQAINRQVYLAPVIYRRSDLERPWRSEWDCNPDTRHRVCVPEELLRIHDHGRIVYGNGMKIGDLPKPTFEEIIGYKERCKDWDEECQRKHPEIRLPDPVPLRLAVQVLLSNAIWHYYFATHRTCFNKHQIADRLRNEVSGYAFQKYVDQATRIRKNGFSGIPDDIADSVIKGCRGVIDWNQRHAAFEVPVNHL